MCTFLPTRYRLALYANIVCFVSVAIWKSFSLLLTHATASAMGSGTASVFFTNCTEFISDRDIQVVLREDTMFLIHSSFAAGFVLLRIPATVLSTRVSPVRVVTACLALSSVITLCLPFVISHSIPLLFLLQAVHGALAGSLHPCVVGIISSWSLEADKGRLFSVAFGGSCLAPAVSAVFSGAVMCYVRWDGALYILGVLGAVWSLVWSRVAYNTPRDHPSLPAAERQLHETHREKMHGTMRTSPPIPWRHILLSLPVWSLFVAYFSRHFIFAMMVMIMGQYFTDAFNINIANVGLLTTLPYVGQFLFCLLGGVVMDKLLYLGLSVTATRKIMFTAGYLPLAANMTPIYSGVISGIGSTGSIGMIARSLIAFFLIGNTGAMAAWQNLFLVAGVMCSTSTIFFNLCVQAKLQPWAFGVTSTLPDTATDTATLTDTDIPRQKRRTSESEPLLPESSC